LSWLRDTFVHGAYQPTALAGLYLLAALLVLGFGALVGTGRRSVDGGARRHFAVNFGLVGALLVALALVDAAVGGRARLAALRLAFALLSLAGPANLDVILFETGLARLRWLRVTAWGLGVALAALAAVSRLVVETADPAPLAGPLAPWSFVHAMGAVLLGLVLCARAAWREPSPARRRRLRAIFVAFAIGALSALDALPVFGASFFGAALPRTGYLTLSASAIILSVAVRRNVLFEAPDLGVRALGWLLASLLALVPVAGLLVAINAWAGWDDPLEAAALLYALFLGLFVYGARVQPFIDGLFRRRQRDLARDLRALGDRLAVVQTPSALAARVARLLAESLDVDLAALAALGDDGELRVVAGPLDGSKGLVSTPGLREPAAPSAPSGPPLPVGPSFLAQQRRAPALVARAHTDADGAALLEQLDAEAVVPLAAGGAGLIGLLAVGRRRDRAPFVDVELGFLARLGVLVADALAAARLYERRRRLGLELERMVAARAAELDAARQRLLAAQAQLVQGEKLATLGLVVGGVAGELGAAVNSVAAAAATLDADVDTLGRAAAAALERRPSAAAELGEARVDFLLEDLRPLAGAIAEGLRRASGIATGLSTFARAGGPERVAVDLRAVVTDALALFTHRPEITVERVDDAELPPVRGEPGPLGQVVLNLLANAAEAIEGPGRITLRTRVDGDIVELAVRDTGKGIAPEHRARLFEPFFTTKEPGGRGGGTGLGLAISYGIVQDHGGALIVESELGQGTTVRVRLPAFHPTV
jgi:signal transduction histidine kinase